MIMCVLNISIIRDSYKEETWDSLPPQKEYAFMILAMYNIIFSEPNHSVFSSIHLMKNEYM